jgi:hypothetical protein
MCRPGSPWLGSRREQVMRRAIRWAVTVGVALAFAGVPGGGFAQDEDVVRPATPRASAETSVKPQGTCEVSDPCEDIATGAASMEPDQAVVEDPGTRAHRDWVESIWTTL